ncbi:MAG: FecR domain-containing protein [Acetivibrio sp.]
MKSRRGYQIFSIILSLLLAVGLPTETLAKEVKASVMRIEQIEGTLTLTDASGREIKAKEGLKLYNGYTLKTTLKSYAYISLDHSKAIKIDASSKVSVQKNGQKIELYVIRGKIFFNVKEKLKGDETFNIRTSTMTTGIRGTSGFITEEQKKGEKKERLNDNFISEIGILDGEAEAIACTENETPIKVSSGNVLEVNGKINPSGGVDKVTYDLKTLSTNEIPGFIGKELIKNPELKQRIEIDLGKKFVEQFLDTVEKRLEEEEKEEEEEEERREKLKEEEEERREKLKEERDENDVVIRIEEDEEEEENKKDKIEEDKENKEDKKDKTEEEKVEEEKVEEEKVEEIEEEKEDKAEEEKDNKKESTSTLTMLKSDI